MDFSLSDDQRAFADMAQSLFADFCADDQLRAHDLSGQPFMAELWNQCVAAGLHGILVPEAAGGLGLGMTELMAVLEQQGRALALVPLWEQQLVLAALGRFAPGEHGARHADGMAGGLCTLSLAGLYDSRGPGLQLAGDARTVRGQAQAVPLGAQSACALLVAGHPDGSLRPVLVDLRAPGVSFESGLSQHHLGVADLRLQDVAVDAVLPATATAWIEQRAVAAVAALQLGVTQQQLERSVDYVSERRQFGRIIGTFQLVAGGLADAQIGVEALRASLWQLVWRLDAGLGCAPQSHATRVLGTELGHVAGHRAQHVHGGIGVDVTYPAHRFLYWSRALGACLGGADLHLTRLGDWLAEHDELGWKYDLPEDRMANT